MPTRILIAEDHLFVSQSLAAALATIAGMTVVGSVANGIEAISAIRRLNPDCAILDYNMPGANGLEVFLEARRWSPETRFILLTGSAQPEIVARMVEAGVHGVMLKDVSDTEIIEVVKQVCAGKTVIAPSARRLLDGAQQGVPMTQREMAVLQAIARGHSNASAAALLGVSPKTVDSHRTSLMRKLNVHSTASLLLAAVRAGLLDPGSLR